MTGRGVTWGTSYDCGCDSQQQRCEPQRFDSAVDSLLMTPTCESVTARSLLMGASVTCFRRGWFWAVGALTKAPAGTGQGSRPA
jgi:hypothetical protein